MDTTLNDKEEELKRQFGEEQKEASAIEEQIKQLQAKYQEKIVNMTRLQGAFSLIQDLKKKPEPELESEPEPYDK